jgi:hypothetical protein
MCTGACVARIACFAYAVCTAASCSTAILDSIETVRVPSWPTSMRARVSSMDIRQDTCWGRLEQWCLGRVSGSDPD